MCRTAFVCLSGRVWEIDVEGNVTKQHTGDPGFSGRKRNWAWNGKRESSAAVRLQLTIREKYPRTLPGYQQELEGTQTASYSQRRDIYTDYRRKRTKYCPVILWQTTEW